MHKKWLSTNGYAWKGHMIKWLCIEKGCHWNDCA